MASGSLHKAIQIIGSRRKVIEALGISAQRFNRWLNDGVVMGYEYALALEYLTYGEVTAKELAPKKAQLLKKLGINLIQEIVWLNQEIIPLKEISLVPEIACENLPVLKKLAEDIKRRGLLRPIAVDCNYQMIFGKYRFWACQSIGNQSLPVVVISLAHLVNEAYPEWELKRRFTVSERAAIGMALERLLGEENVETRPFNQTPHYTVDLGKKLNTAIAKKVGFGSLFIYEQAKKIINFGSCELIQMVDEGNMAVSRAVLKFSRKGK